MANVNVDHVPLSNGDVGIFRDQDAVRKTAQTLTDAEKAQSRTNIGAAPAAELTTLNNNAIKKTAQTLTAAEKTQTRTNIGAINPPNLASVTKKLLPNNEEWTNVTSEGGWYNATVVNTDTAGEALVYITNSSKRIYYGSGYNQSAKYTRAATGWIYIPEGTVFSVLIIRASSGADTNSGLYFAPPL